MAGEDFAYYLQKVPGAFLLLGSRPEGLMFPHHSPHFGFNEQALVVGLAVWQETIRTFLV
jgi:metal-dependent amidase/aminoacylase/carboxypeptidase family protein